MNIYDPLKFGRYQGLTIQQIFSGTPNIDRDLLSAYLAYRLKVGDILDEDDTLTTNMFNFDIDRTLIKVTPTLPDFNLDASKSLEKFFRSGDSLGAKLSNLSLDHFCYDIYPIKHSPPLNIGGVPEYIEWCIKTIAHFYIKPYQIEQLEAEVVNYFLGISVNKVGETIYEYSPKILSKHYKFTDYYLKINKSKTRLNPDLELF